MWSAAARLLGTGDGSKALSFDGGNGASRAVAGSRCIGGGLGTSTGLGGSQGATNYDGKGTYILQCLVDVVVVLSLAVQLGCGCGFSKYWFEFGCVFHIL
jgi:hypothetical protein